MSKSDFNYCTFYKPDHDPVSVAQNASMYVKFSQAAFFTPSFCDAWDIPYEESDLEDTCMGKMLRYKNDDGTKAERFE